uniref:HNH endonuclease n=1 Tax=Candidatus Kentrum sp. LFY TaxID=2126342 RepID=A0A450V989_9GAMM|nr:MAG: hypothetical protein BECKLFY1418A_GA0070994_11444 [Candidatus Kentron sp. LFY]
MTERPGKKTCYLCGEPGADSKDHLPPKSLLPPASNRYLRITVPAHSKCNSAESADEEYLRDLIVPEAMQFGYKDVEMSYEKVWRAWSREGGWARYQRFLYDHVIVEMRTPEGLYAGKAVGIRPEVERVQRVGKKIVRGLIFHDSGAFITADSIVVAPLPTRDVPATKARDAAEPYWRALSNPACIHTMCGDHSAMRRIYIGHPSADGIVLESHFAIILWTLYFVASSVFLLDSVTKTDFAFAADISMGWSVPDRIRK